MSTKSALLVVLIISCLPNVQGLNYKQPGCYNYQVAGCPFVFEPVCGSNGVTYPNECVLCETIRETGTKILVAKSGPC
uniref:serine protease inhibitor Kazal-type 1-like n=1 Tax=Centroberyx gerrardi TaxID=166262 RepID=UPI003AADE910